MSSRDDPFGGGERTVIRRLRPQKEKPIERPASAKPQATVLHEGFEPPAGWDAARSNAAPQRTSAAPLMPGNVGARVEYATANPFLAAAAPILILLGQLQLNPSELSTGGLADHLAVQIEDFDRRVSNSATREADTRAARYLLCETVDDIVRNLPGTDSIGWMRLGMLARFFDPTDAGVGFFDTLNKALIDPAAHSWLLELAHACLALGFMGQYRGLEGGADAMERIRRDVYQSIRYFHPRPGDEISPHWQGAAARMAKPRA